MLQGDPKMRLCKWIRRKLKSKIERIKYVDLYNWIFKGFLLRRLFFLLHLFRLRFCWVVEGTAEEENVTGSIMCCKYAMKYICFIIK